MKFVLRKEKAKRSSRVQSFYLQVNNGYRSYGVYMPKKGLLTVNYNSIISYIKLGAMLSKKFIILSSFLSKKVLS